MDGREEATLHPVIFLLYVCNRRWIKALTGVGSWRDTKDHVYCRVPPAQHLIDWGPSASSLLSSSWCWPRLSSEQMRASESGGFITSLTDHNSSQFSVLIVLRKCNLAWVCNIDPWSWSRLTRPSWVSLMSVFPHLDTSLPPGLLWIRGRRGQVPSLLFPVDAKGLSQAYLGQASLNARATWPVPWLPLMAGWFYGFGCVLDIFII